MWVYCIYDLFIFIVAWFVVAHHAHHVPERDYGNPWELLKQSSPLTVGYNWFRRGLLRCGISVENTGSLDTTQPLQLDVRPFYSSSWGWGLVIKPYGTRVTVCCLGRGLVIWCESSLHKSILHLSDWHKKDSTWALFPWRAELNFRTEALKHVLIF